MSTTAQIEANRQNAQSSTGPVTPEGKQRSSLNALSHGFTGQNILVSAAEKEAYETHSISVIEQYQPQTHEETSLIQQYSDHHWTLHQINVQQINVLGMLNAATVHHIKTGGDFDTLNAATGAFYKQLNTLSIYEQRRRRAADATLAQFKVLAEARRLALADAAKTCKAMKAQGKPFIPADFGFVHSVAEIETYLDRQARIADLRTAPNANKS